MRIRKGRLARGNASSVAMASSAHMMDTVSQEQSSSRGRKLHEYSGAMEQQRCRNVTVAEPGGIAKAPLALLERLQISPPERPYMNLDEFVTSLARKNCFPADDGQDYSDDHITGHSSCGLINNEYCSVQSTTGSYNDEESPDFSRLYCGTEDLRGDIVAVETSLRLSSGSAHPHYKPAHPRATTLVELDLTEQEMEADQTMKSCTERSGKHTRVFSSTGRKRECLEQTDEVADEASSDSSESVAAKKKRTSVSGSSSTLRTFPNVSEKRKDSGNGKSVAAKKMIKTATIKRAANQRSGRPRKLKFLQQENVEELGNQCNRRDGKGWTCPLLAKPGYQLCDHHLDKLRCKPGSRSKYNKGKKKVAQAP